MEQCYDNKDRTIYPSLKDWLATISAVIIIIAIALGTGWCLNDEPASTASIVHDSTKFEKRKHIIDLTDSITNARIAYLKRSGIWGKGSHTDITFTASPTIWSLSEQIKELKLIMLQCRQPPSEAVAGQRYKDWNGNLMIYDGTQWQHAALSYGAIMIRYPSGDTLVYDGKLFRRLEIPNTVTLIPSNRPSVVPYVSPSKDLALWPYVNKMMVDSTIRQNHHFEQRWYRRLSPDSAFILKDSIHIDTRKLKH